MEGTQMENKRKGFKQEDIDDFVDLDCSDQQYKQIQEEKKQKEKKKNAPLVRNEPKQEQTGPRKFFNSEQAKQPPKEETKEQKEEREKKEQMY